MFDGFIQLNSFRARNEVSLNLIADPLPVIKNMAITVTALRGAASMTEQLSSGLPKKQIAATTNFCSRASVRFIIHVIPQLYKRSPKPFLVKKSLLQILLSTGEVLI